MTHLFEPSLMPWRAHAPAGRARELEARHLARYLWGTVDLELDVIVPTLDDLAARRLPSRAGATAVARLRQEEAAHAAEAAALAATLRLPRPGPPAMLRRLGARLAAARPEDRVLLRFLFVAISETLVSAPLDALAESPRVDPAVRAFVGAHAADEAWHATWFAARLADVWAALEPAVRARLGPQLPGLLDDFLAPDEDAIAADLVAVGLAPDVAAGVAAETAAPAGPAARLFERSARPLAAFAAAGTLAHPPTRAALSVAGHVLGAG